MTAVEQAEVHRRESRSLVTLTLVLCLTGAAMGLVTLLARWGEAARPWPPAMGTSRGLIILGGWILLLAALAGKRAVSLTRQSAGILRERRRRDELVDAFDTRAYTLVQSGAQQALYELVLDTALELVGGDTGSLMHASPADRELTIVAARGLSQDIIRTSRIQFGDRIAGLVAETGRALLLGPAPMPAEIESRLQRQDQLSSSICAPLLAGDAAIGILSVNRLHDRLPFSADDLESVVRLAVHAEGLLAGLAPELSPEPALPVQDPEGSLQGPRGAGSRGAPMAGVGSGV